MSLGLILIRFWQKRKSYVEPINWLLLTTLAITSAADVVQYLRWYSYRWLIERYHYVLKSGCRVEQLSLFCHSGQSKIREDP